MVLLLRCIPTFREDVFNVRDPFLLAVSMSLQHDMFMILEKARNTSPDLASLITWHT